MNDFFTVMKFEKKKRYNYLNTFNVSLSLSLYKNKKRAKKFKKVSLTNEFEKKNSFSAQFK
jgi:hypothetical protein